MDHNLSATRYPIKAPIHFRAWGKFEWQEGMTVNISRSGVLFETQVELELGTIVAMRIVLPLDIRKGSTRTVQCWGRVARKDSIAAGDRAQTVFAAEILRYRFVD
jgi:hypothetical protein